MPLRLKVLGGARVENENGLIRGRAAHRRRLAILALLASAPGGFLGREKIIALLWPESPEDSARHLLSESLYVLRKELHDDLVSTNGDEIGIDPNVLECDVISFRQAVCARDWSQAVELYGGPFLDGFFVEEAPHFEEWAEIQRREIGTDYARALEGLAEASEGAGDPASASEWWGRLAVYDPYNARTVLRLMRSLAACGERVRAVQVAASFSSRLRDEMEIEPDPAVQELADRLRSEPLESLGMSSSAPPPVPRPVILHEPELPLRSLTPEFELIRSIGQGSMARVYLAREPVLGRLVAIKVLEKRYAEDGTARLRFEREARAAARIQHPYVVTVFRVGHLSEDEPFLVMPYINGGSLEDRLVASGPLSLTDSCRFIAQIAAGLTAAHRLHLVHRDVRPANVLYDRDTDRVLLTDFGLAAVLESGQERVLRLTRPGEQLGSPAYASPEQLRGEPVTEQADVYSLGVVAFELFTGRLPYDAETSLQMTAAHIRNDPWRISEFRSEVSPAVDDLIYRCLHKRPEQRPFAADIVDALA